MKETKQIGIKLDTELWKAIKILALLTNNTATSIVEYALDQHIRNCGYTQNYLLKKGKP